MWGYVQFSGASDLDFEVVAKHIETDEELIEQARAVTLGPSAPTMRRKAIARSVTDPPSYIVKTLGRRPG